MDETTGEQLEALALSVIAEQIENLLYTDWYTSKVPIGLEEEFQVVLEKEVQAAVKQF